MNEVPRAGFPGSNLAYRKDPAQFRTGMDGVGLMPVAVGTGLRTAADGYLGERFGEEA